jgi:hypothetical protein
MLREEYGSDEARACGEDPVGHRAKHAGPLVEDQKKIG